MGQIYTAVVEAIAVSGATAFFNLQAPSNSRLKVKEVRIGQTSDVGDAAAENLAVRFVRAQTAYATEGGVELTPQNRWPWSRAAGTRVVRNATLATEGGKCLVSDAMNIATGWLWIPEKGGELWIRDGSNLAIALSAPADALTMHGTVTFEEDISVE